MSTGFIEVNIETAPERINFNNDLKCLRKKHGIRHYVTGTMHSHMGDTFNSMAISISEVSKPFNLWDRGKLIVSLSRTRTMENAIFVVLERDTINALKNY